MTSTTPSSTTTTSGSRAALWQEYWTRVRNQDWLTARQLLEISPRAEGFFACYAATEQIPTYDEDGHERPRSLRDLGLDGNAAAGRIDADGLSCTERRLAMLVAALTTGQPLDLQFLSRMWSWSLQVWQILLHWCTDGAATLHHQAGRDGPARRPGSTSRDGGR